MTGKPDLPDLIEAERRSLLRQAGDFCEQWAALLRAAAAARDLDSATADLRKVYSQHSPMALMAHETMQAVLGQDPAESRSAPEHPAPETPKASGGLH